MVHRHPEAMGEPPQPLNRRLSGARELPCLIGDNGEDGEEYPVAHAYQFRGHFSPGSGRDTVHERGCGAGRGEHVLGYIHTVTSIIAGFIIPKSFFAFIFYIFQWVAALVFIITYVVFISICAYVIYVLVCHFASRMVDKWKK